MVRFRMRGTTSTKNTAHTEWGWIQWVRDGRSLWLRALSVFFPSFAPTKRFTIAGLYGRPHDIAHSTFVPIRSPARSLAFVGGRLFGISSLREERRIFIVFASNRDSNKIFIGSLFHSCAARVAAADSLTPPVRRHAAPRRQDDKGFNRCVAIRYAWDFYDFN